VAEVAAAEAAEVAEEEAEEAEEEEEEEAEEEEEEAEEEAEATAEATAGERTGAAAARCRRTSCDQVESIVPANASARKHTWWRGEARRGEVRWWGECSGWGEVFRQRQQSCHLLLEDRGGDLPRSPQISPDLPPLARSARRRSSPPPSRARRRAPPQSPAGRARATAARGDEARLPRARRGLISGDLGRSRAISGRLGWSPSREKGPPTAARAR